MEESTKSKIDLMSISELEADIKCENKSPFRTKGKRKYIIQRLSELNISEASQRHSENIEAQNSSTKSNKPDSEIIKTWWVIVGGLALACLLYIFRKHFGINL